MGFRNVRIGSITTVGDIAGPFSPDAQRYGKDFSISLHSHSAGSPWSGTIQVERSTDNGVSWTVVSIDAAGTPANHTSRVQGKGVGARLCIVGSAAAARGPTHPSRVGIYD